MEPISRRGVSLAMNRPVTGFLVVVVALLALTGCQPADEVTGTLRGEVLAGPVCPVVTDPPDPACADRPVADATLVVEVVGSGEVARITTDVDGLFEISLPPGGYTLVPHPVAGLLGTAPPESFEIQPDETTDLTVVYDTGIR